MTKPDIDPVDSLIRSAHVCEQALDQALRSVKCPGGLKLTYSKFLLLDHIARHDGCARVDITEALGTSASNYSTTIRQLISLGLIDEDVQKNNYVRRKRFLRLHPSAIDILLVARDKVYATKQTLVDTHFR